MLKMNQRTINFVYILTVTTWILNHQVVCQYDSSGDGIAFEDDDDISSSSGAGPIRPSVGTPVPPSILKPERGQDSRVPASIPSSTKRPDNEFEEGSGDIRFEDKLIPSISNTSNNNSPPFSPGVDDEDEEDYPEESGETPFEPEIKEEVPDLGAEIIVDPSTPHPTVSRSATLSTTSGGISLVARSTSAPPPKYRPSGTTQDLIIQPEDSYSTTSPAPSNPSIAGMAFFKLFKDPLILAGIIAGAVLAILCIVLIIMFMVYRMRKKDEGSYALGEPRKAHDIRYTRTNDQEYYA